MYFEEHFAISLLPVQTHIQHMQHRHRVSAARDRDQVRKLFLGLTMSHKTVLKSVRQIILEALTTARLFLYLDCGALLLTFEAELVCR